MTARRISVAGFCLIGAVITVALFSAGAAAYYGPTIVSDNPVGYWPLDEGAGPTATDASGNGEDGTYTGNVIFGVSSGVGGGGDSAVVLAPKTGPFVNHPAGTITLGDSGLATGGSDFTFEAWIEPSPSFSSQLIASQAAPGAGSCIAAQGWKLELTRDDSQTPRLRFELDTGDVAPSGSDCTSPSQVIAFSASAPGLLDGSWHYVAVSVCHACDSATVWVDSASQVTSGVPDGGPTDAFLNIADPFVGVPIPAGQYLGVDEPALYFYALDDAQIGDHYAEGTKPTTATGGVVPAAGTPAAPAAALSHYITQAVRPLTGTSSATSLGCKQGTTDSAIYGGETKLVLDFGVQNSNLTSTTLVGSPNTMPYSSSSTTSPGIVQWVETFVKAYYTCYIQRGGNGVVFIGVGTNNDTTGISSAYGASWIKNVVTPIQNWVSARGYDWVAIVIGAVDFEPGFHGSAIGSMNWAAGWAANGGYQFINYGSADGCSATTYTNGACSGTWGSGSNPSPCPSSSHWNQCVLWWLSWGTPQAYSFPEIYYDTTKNYAHQGLQWTMISRYGYYYQSGLRIGFDGPLVTISGYTPKSSYNQFWCDLHSSVSFNTCGTGVNTTLGPRGATSTATEIFLISKIVWG